MDEFRTKGYAIVEDIYTPGEIGLIIAHTKGVQFSNDTLPGGLNWRDGLS